MKLGKTIWLLILVSVLVLSACGSQPTPEAKEPAATEAVAAEPTAEAAPTEAPEAPAAEGKIVVIALGHELSSLDPARAMEPTATMIHQATYDTLVTLTADGMGDLVPALAESWDVSDDGLVYTFILREGVQFPSGNTMTSEDVKWSWERAKNVKGNPSWLFDGVESIETPDDTTVVLTLTSPDSGFLFKSVSGAFSVLDSETVAANGGVSGPEAETGDQAEEWLNENSAGTGPFALTNWALDSEIVIDQVDTSWRGVPNVDTVIYKHIPQTAARKLALEAGDVDFALNLTKEQAEALTTNEDVEVVSGPGMETFFLLANRNPDLTDGVMSDPLVVQAMSYAIDYEGVKALAGYAAAHSPTVIPTGLYGAWDESKAVTRDLDKAKELLVEAGYPDGFAITLPYPTEFTTSGVDFDLLAQKVQADLAEAGIEVTLEPTELMTNLADYRAGTLGFTMWPWLPGAPDINDYLEFLPGGVVGTRAQWTEERADPEILELRDQARAESDPAKRLEIWDQIQQYMVEKGPFVNLVQAGLQMGVRKNITGYVYNPFWWVDPFLLVKE